MASRSKSIAARRKLSDLYAKGVSVRFNADGARKGPFETPVGDDEVEVYVQPPSPLQREMALREATAVRARAVLNAKRDNDSEEYLTAMSFVAGLGDDTLQEYVVQGEADDYEREALRDVMAEPEWEDITTLQDAMRQFEDAGSPEGDPEYVGLIERDKEFGRQVHKRLEEIQEAAREVLSRTPREALEKRALERRAELLSTQTFMRSYERQMLFFACRDPEDHTALFFDQIEELAEQPEFVQEELGSVLATFIGDGGQAKNLRRVASGSDSSAPPDEPETSAPSTPEA